MNEWETAELDRLMRGNSDLMAALGSIDIGMLVKMAFRAGHAAGIAVPCNVCGKPYDTAQPLGEGNIRRIAREEIARCIWECDGETVIVPPENL